MCVCVSENEHKQFHPHPHARHRTLLLNARHRTFFFFFFFFDPVYASIMQHHTFPIECYRDVDSKATGIDVAAEAKATRKRYDTDVNKMRMLRATMCGLKVKLNDDGHEDADVATRYAETKKQLYAVCAPWHAFMERWFMCAQFLPALTKSMRAVSSGSAGDNARLLKIDTDDYCICVESVDAQLHATAYADAFAQVASQYKINSMRSAFLVGRSHQTPVQIWPHIHWTLFST
jgi:hypothetical protein